MDRFYWVVNRDVRVSFEPLFPTEREGSDPDAVVDAMRQIGFDLSDTESDVELPMEGAFALAEHLTGVRLTPDLLESATYLGGLAPRPRS